MAETVPQSPDLIEGLQSLVPLAVQASASRGLPCLGDDLTSRQEEIFVYPFSNGDRKLRLVPFYGNVISSHIFQSTASSEVVERVDDVSQSRQRLRTAVQTCATSVPQTLHDVANLNLTPCEVYFAHQNGQLDYRSSRIEAPSEELVYTSPVTLNGNSCSNNFEVGTSDLDCLPNEQRLMEILRACGAANVAFGLVPKDVIVHYPSRYRTFSVNAGERHLGNRLKLARDTLEFKSWSVYSSAPMSCYVMSTHQSGVNLQLWSSIRKSISLADVRGIDEGSVPEMFTSPELGGLLRRSDVGYSSTEGSGISFVHDRGQERVYYFTKDDVPFKLIIRKGRKFAFRRGNNESYLVREHDCQPILKFPLSTNASRLSEVVTCVIMALLRAIREENGLSLTRVPNYIRIGETDKTLSSRDLKALQRIRFEEGSLRHLLGLPDDASRATVEDKCRELIEHWSSCDNKILSRRHLSTEVLIRKLKNASLREGNNFKFPFT